MGCELLMHQIQMLQGRKLLICLAILLFLICTGMTAIQAQQPSWGFSSWIPVEQGGVNSHQPVTYCSSGSFVTGLDLDRCSNCDPHDSPVIGQAQCSNLAGAESNGWEDCRWVEVGAAKSHQMQYFCPDGYYITGLDLDGPKQYSGNDAPIVGQVQCCKLSGYNSWATSGWWDVQRAGINSHQPNNWCPDGYFLIGLDLDGTNADDLDAPVVGAAACACPKPVTKADLTVLGISPSRDGNTIYIGSDVANIGTALATGFDVIVKWDGPLGSADKKTGSNFIVQGGYLVAGKTMHYGPGTFQGEPGLYNIEVVADPDNAVEELNEGNNHYYAGTIQI